MFNFADLFRILLMFGPSGPLELWWHREADTNTLQCAGGDQEFDLKRKQVAYEVDEIPEQHEVVQCRISELYLTLMQLMCEHMAPSSITRL